MAYECSKAGIYKITFKGVNRPYIGSSSNISQRKSQHLYLLRRDNHPNPKLQNYYNKYTENNLEFIVIETILNENDFNYICHREQEYLNRYHAQEYIDSNFYDRRFDDLLLNVNPEVNQMRVHWDEERRQNLIERNKSFEWTDEVRKKLSDSHKGKVRSEEAKKATSKSLFKYYSFKKDGHEPCPHCCTLKVRKVGKRFVKTCKKYVQRYYCVECDKRYQIYLD